MDELFSSLEAQARQSRWYYTGKIGGLSNTGGLPQEIHLRVQHRDKFLNVLLQFSLDTEMEPVSKERN